MSQTISNLNTNDVAVSTWEYPAEKARALTFPLNFTGAATTFAVDLAKAYEAGTLTTFQTVFIDNSLNSAVFTLSVDQTQQNIAVAPYSQGYYAIQAPKAARLTFTTVGVSEVIVICLNVAVPSAVWNNQEVSSQGDTGTNAAGVMAMGLVRVDPVGPLAINTVQPLFMDQYGAMLTTLYPPNSNYAAIQQVQTDGTYSGVVMLGGFYNTAQTEATTGTAAALQTDAYNSLYVDTECNSPVYSAAAWYGNPTGATDTFTIFGSATKTIRIHSITFTSSESVLIFIIRRSTTNTGGTSSPVTAVPHDTNSAAATATVLTYSVNPTALGTAVGAIEVNNGSTPYTWTYGATDQSLVLRGVNQGICINLSTSSSSGVVGFKIKWSEV